MKICHLSSEFTPFIKAGGLADIVYGLSSQFHQMGHFVRVMLPYFSTMEELGLELITEKFEATWGTERIACTIKRGVYQGIELILMDPHPEAWKFDGKSIYGYAYDVEKFALFSHLCVDYLKFEKVAWDIIHCHDWVTSLAIVLLKEVSFTKTVLTIHNAAYQGICSSKVIDRCTSLPQHLKATLMEGTHLNLLRAGILNAGKITTVSPTYREELLTPEGGKNLTACFAARGKDFFGIINGLDERFWNPTLDPLLPCHFDLTALTPQQINQVLMWKRLHRQFLHTDLGLSLEGPLLISIGRLVEQKAPQLILEAGKTILAQGGVFVLLGSTHDKDLENQFKKEFPKSPRCHLSFNFDERLSHLLYAAGDLICVPSRFEPCGLTQMIGMRYGVVPIVRRVGGLADTVFDVETSSVQEDKKCGYTFDHDNVEGLHWGLDRAIRCYYENKPLWNTLILRGMLQDFSWNGPSAVFQQLYVSLLSSSSHGNVTKEAETLSR